MKYFALFISILLIASCGKNDTASSNGAATEKPTETKAAEKAEPLSDPCSIPASEIASIIGWEDYSEGQPNAINSDKMKVCDYSSNLGGSLSIAYQQHKITNPEGRYLERSFTKDIKNDSGDMTFKEVSGVPGDQAIFYYGQQGPNYMYNLRWRYGNHTEKRIFLRSTSERDAGEAEEKLKEIAGKL